jgi:glycerol 3-phosphatase-2
VTLDTTHACVVDLDGVVWLGGTALPGALDGVNALRDGGIPVVFATNNAAPTVAELLGKLAAIGVAAESEEVVTSAQAAASLLEPGSTAYVVGEAGIREALGAVGVRESDEHPDAVVVGLTTAFDYATCARASTFIRRGARYLATNVDATLPGPNGLLPGAGSIVASVSTASGSSPIVAGKPHEPMARLVRRRTDVGAVIGDRPSTDGAFAERLGVAFVQVTSDVEEPTTAGTETVRTLLEAVERLLS